MFAVKTASFLSSLTKKVWWGVGCTGDLSRFQTNPNISSNLTMKMKSPITSLFLLFVFLVSAAKAEISEGLLLRNRLEVSELELRHANTLLAGMVESEIETLYMIPQSGMLMTAEKLKISLTELFKYGSEKFTDRERKEMAEVRVRQWEHKLSRADLREEISLLKREIAGLKEQLRRMGGGE